jgi:hypothetical protein
VVVSLLPGRAPVRAVAIPLQCSSADHSGYTFRLRLFTQRAHGSEQTVIFRCHMDVTYRCCLVVHLSEPWRFLFSERFWPGSISNVIRDSTATAQRQHSDSTATAQDGQYQPTQSTCLHSARRYACKSVSASMSVHHSHMNYHIASSWLA